MTSLWATQQTPCGPLSVSTRKASSALTPANILDVVAGGAFATPLDDSDDTPRGDDAGTGWGSGDSRGSPERAEVRRPVTAG